MIDKKSLNVDVKEIPEMHVAYVELYLNNPEEHLEHKHIVDIYLPVKPLW
jgi:DNA gyrase inhibitor GyrI